jgi:hypothetical protein
MVGEGASTLMRVNAGPWLAASLPRMQRNQFLIAVFDDRDSLARVLGELGAEAAGRAAVLLHESADEPSGETVTDHLQRMTEVHFTSSLRCVRCTAGGLANALAARAAGGASSLAEALHGWLTPEQARDFERHVASGRLLLWLPPTSPEDFETMCARLVQASPHLVALCTIDLAS